jgi:N-acetylglucosamine kinase-like BadF-type ATPase
MVKRMNEQNSTPETSFYLGFDGGGTKTDCILMDADANVLARATAGPSNPLRAGYAKAWFTLSDAADVVLERHHLKASDIRGICAGIGGAVGEGEGIILVVGTGSAAYGRDAQGHTARAGGRGPWFSDEGSAFDIGRRALAAVVRAEENRGPQTALSAKMLKWLGCTEWTRVLDWVVKNPDDVFPRIFPLVGELGDKGDAVACDILTTAAASLGDLAHSVIGKLAMQDREISIAKAGGTNGRSKFFDAAIDARLHELAPHAHVVGLQMKPAEAAAKMAIGLGKRKAHAG